MLQESNARTRKGPCVVNASSFDGEVVRSATKAACTAQCRPIDTLMMQHKKLSGFRNNEKTFHRQIESPKKGPSGRTTYNLRYRLCETDQELPLIVESYPSEVEGGDEPSPSLLYRQESSLAR